MDDGNNENDHPHQFVDIHEIDKTSYVQTFKIYKDTKFDNLKRAACAFWGVEDFLDSYMLTDEYFNNLSTFTETVQSFFSENGDYEVINRGKFACLFLLKKNE